MKFSITKDMLKKSLTKAGPKWLSLTDDIIENTYSGVQSAVDKALDTAAKEGLTGKKLRAAGQEAYDNFIEQAQHDISSDIFDQKINNIINSRFNGKFNNLTIFGNAETGAGIADDIWNKYTDSKGLYGFSSQELDETIANELNTIQSHVGNYRAQQAKTTGLLNKEIAEQRMANLPDPREGLGEIQQQIRMNKYWEEQDAKIAQIKANAQTDPLAEKLSKASETIEDVQAPEQINVKYESPANSLYPTTYAGDGTVDDLYGEIREEAQTRASTERRIAESQKYYGEQKTDAEEMWDLYNSSTKKKTEYKPNQTQPTPWSTTARAVLGTAVVGAGICAALSSSRGQQNNAQLYGQQPLY